jgi:hypothetical protein
MIKVYCLSAPGKAITGLEVDCLWNISYAFIASGGNFLVLDYESFCVSFNGGAVDVCGRLHLYDGFPGLIPSGVRVKPR